MRQTGWYRVRHKLNDRWEFAEYYNESWWITGQESPIGEEYLVINEELQNPEPPKKNELRMPIEPHEFPSMKIKGWQANPMKTGLDGCDCLKERWNVGEDGHRY